MTQEVALRRFLRQTLPRTPQGTAIVFGAALDSIAFGMYLAAATIYFVSVQGLPAVQIAVALSAANVCGLISPLLAGWLADRIGARTVFVGLLLLRAALFACYTMVHDVPGYLITTCLLAAATRAGIPLMQLLVGKYEGAAHRVRTMAAVRTVANVGLGAGFLLAAMVQAIGTQLAFRLLFFSCALALASVAVVVHRATCRHPDAEAGHPADLAPEAAEPATPDSRSPYADGPFLLFALSYTVLLLHDSILFVVLPLWLVEDIHLPAGTSSVLLVVNTVLSVVLQIYLARLANGGRASRLYLRGAAACLVVACGLLWLSEQGPVWAAIIGAIAAVVLLTVGENLQAVAGWDISYRISSEARRAQYLSIFSMTGTAQAIAGPVLLTIFVISGGPAGWLVVAGAFVAAAVAIEFVLYGLSAQSSPAEARLAG